MNALNIFVILSLAYSISFSQTSGPTLLSPGNNQEVGTEPILSWNPLTGSLAYSLRVIDISTLEFPDTIIAANISTGTRTSQQVFGLQPNKKYKWYVDAYYEPKPNSFYRSSTFEFLTKSPKETNGNGVGITDVGMWYQPFGVADSDREFEALSFDKSYIHSPLNTNNEFDFHLKNLADVKVDFIMFDNSNGGFDSKVDDTPNTAGLIDNYSTSSQTQSYVANSTNMCNRIKNWNDNNSWQIKYSQVIGIWEFEDTTVTPRKSYYLKNKNSPIVNASSFGDCVNSQALAIWNNFVNNSVLGGSANYYRLGGKPLLLLYNGVDLGNLLTKWYTYAQSSDYQNSAVKNFTVRFATNGDKGTYGWHAWGKGSAPPDTNIIGTVIDKEVEIVSPGSYLFGAIYPDACKNGKCIVPRERGRYYREKCWKRVFANPRPRIISIVSFLDHDERTAIWPSRKSANCQGVDCDWKNENGLVDANMYWNMTKNYIDTLRMPIIEKRITKGNYLGYKDQSFFISSKEISQWYYKELMNVNPSLNLDDQNPVENVTFYDAILFCNALSRKNNLTPVYTFKGSQSQENPCLMGDPGNGCDIGGIEIEFDSIANGFRLPKEDEWIFAYRAGTNTDYYWGENFDGNYAWYRTNSGNPGKSHAVGTKLPNAWDLYDMAGNVREWIWDCYGENCNPGTSVYADGKGGGYNDTEDMMNWSYRIGGFKNSRWGIVGFRVIRNLKRSIVPPIVTPLLLN